MELGKCLMIKGRVPLDSQVVSVPCRFKMLWYHFVLLDTIIFP